MRGPGLPVRRPAESTPLPPGASVTGLSVCGRWPRRRPPKPGASTGCLFLEPQVGAGDGPARALDQAPDPELGLRQELLAAAFEGDAALVELDRPLQRLASGLELGDRLLEGRQ